MYQATRERCNTAKFRFSIFSCGNYNLSLFGKSEDSGVLHPLGNLTLQLPLYPKLLMTEKKLTSAKLEFDSTFRSCTRDRVYVINCGSLWNILQREEEMIVTNLFPGQSYTCEYSYLEGAELKTELLEFESEKLDFDEVPFFSIVDEGIYLQHHSLPDLLEDSNLSISVTTTNLVTNETFMTPGDLAASSGINGIRPNGHYKICLTISQLESHYELHSQEWCHQLATVRPYSDNNNSSSNNNNNAELWIVLSIVATAVLLLAVSHFRRSDRARQVIKLAREIREACSAGKQ